MKRFLVSILSVFWMVFAVDAQVTQTCVVLQYNRDEKKTPLPGVEVMVSNAGSQVSDAEGRLTLRFRTLKTGDRVQLLGIHKQGFELMNKDAVEQWNVSSDQKPFEIVMVSSAYFAQLKDRLMQKSSDSYKAKYQQAVHDLEAERKAGKLKEEEFNRKYDELESRYRNQLMNLDRYVDQFARIDLSEVSAEEQRILELVEAGRIDEAVLAYEKLDISGRLRAAREAKQALTEIDALLKEEEVRQDSLVRELEADHHQ